MGGGLYAIIWRRHGDEADVQDDHRKVEVGLWVPWGIQMVPVSQSIQDCSPVMLEYIKI